MARRKDDPEELPLATRRADVQLGSLRCVAAEQAKPAITQEQRDAARQAGTWGRVEDIGRQAREADRARQGPDHERPGERQGPSMGR